MSVTGAGYWGKNLVRVFYELGNLYSICESDVETLEEFSKKYPDIRRVSDFEEILKDEKVDAVIIAVPAEMHYTYAKKALLAGKHVFVEKPLSLTYDKAEDLIKLADDLKKILMVGHLLHYHPVFKKLKSMVHSGQLGEIVYIYSNRLNFGKVRMKENVLWSFAPHDISMILSLIKGFPKTVFSEGGCYLQKKIPDVVMININFQNDIKSHIFVSWLHPYKKQNLVVIGDKKIAVFEDTKQWDNKLLIYEHKIEHLSNISRYNKRKAVKIKVIPSEPLKEECAHFINCVKNNIQPLTNGREGLAVLRILEMAQKSMDENKIIKT